MVTLLLNPQHRPGELIRKVDIIIGLPAETVLRVTV